MSSATTTGSPPTTPPTPAPTTPSTAPAESPYIGYWWFDSAILIVDAYGDYWSTLATFPYSSPLGCVAYEAGELNVTTYVRAAWGPDNAGHCDGGQEVGPEALMLTAVVQENELTLTSTFGVYSHATGDVTPQADQSTWTATQLSGAPSLEAVAGTWTLRDGNQIVIAQDGSFTIDDSVGTSSYGTGTDCMVTGQVSIGDTAVPIYTINATETNGCQGNMNEAGDAGTGVFVVQQGLVGGIAFVGTGNENMLLPF